MTTGQAVVPRNRRPKGRHSRPRDPDGRRKRTTKKLPEYPEPYQVEVLIRAVPNQRARLLFLIEWRAGLKISEAPSLEARDPSLRTVDMEHASGRPPHHNPRFALGSRYI